MSFLRKGHFVLVYTIQILSKSVNRFVERFFPNSVNQSKRTLVSVRLSGLNEICHRALHSTNSCCII